ncbi:MAG: hypothetical protein ACU836_09720 [Gammaproteobacteria bacterium]
MVERTFGSQTHWFNGKTFRYVELAKAHAWHSLLAMTYNLKRLPSLFIIKPTAASLLRLMGGTQRQIAVNGSVRGKEQALSNEFFRKIASKMS